MKKIHITTMGCSKNLVDSEVLAGQLTKNSFELTEIPDEADVIIVNTCGFIKDAKEESIQAILEAVELKKGDSGKQVFVAGCLSQRYGKEIANEIPEVDAIFGTEKYMDILARLKGNHAAIDNLHRARRVSTPNHFAYLKISEGCNHTCAFCAIPGIRGKHRSRSIESLLDEAKVLADNGARELILISQDSSYYGIDLYGKQKILTLLEDLNKIDGIDWIRVMYWYPTNFPMDVLPLMQSDHKLVPYIDMPLQHISDRMLRLMRRGDTEKSIRAKLERIRQNFPEIALRTTLILGHPGETKEDYEQLELFVKEIKFNRLGTFVYSDEEGTPAMELTDKVSESVARHRQDRIMKIQREISLRHNRNLLNKTIPLMIDEKDVKRNLILGRTPQDAPEIDNEVHITARGTQKIDPGMIVKGFVKDFTEYEIFADIAN